jgi:hypothetical protein
LHLYFHISAFPAHGSSWHPACTGCHTPKYQFIENTYLTLRRILNIITAMQKTVIFTDRRTVLQTGKPVPAGSKRTGSQSRSLWHLNTRKTLPAISKVSKAISKVNKVNIQFAAGGFHLRRQMACCVLSTSKRFQYLKTACPRRFMQGDKTRSEVVRLRKKGKEPFTHGKVKFKTGKI